MIDIISTYRARLAIPIIVAIIALIGVIITAVTSFAIAYYQNRYQDTDISVGETQELTFNASSGFTSETFEISTHTGDVGYGFTQTEGAIGTKYKVYHKKATSGNWSLSRIVTISKNNVCTPQYWLMKTNYGVSYDVCVTKTNYFTTKSKALFDWMLTIPGTTIN